MKIFMDLCFEWCLRLILGVCLVKVCWFVVFEDKSEVEMWFVEIGDWLDAWIGCTVKYSTCRILVWYTEY